jgi:glucokinase
MDQLVIGIDLGASKIALGLVGSSGAIVATRRFPTEAAHGPDHAVERIAAAIDELTAEAGARPAAVGVCSPGPVDHVAGVILDPPNLGWHNVAFRDMLAERLRLPITLEHDAKAAALGEFYFGAGPEHGARDLAYVIVGTGVGAAIVLDGQLYRGRHNSAGEVGHITIDRHGEPGSAGVPGCVESYTSGPYLVHQYRKRSGQAEGDLTGQAIVELAQRGDAHARAVLDDAGDALAACVGTMAMIMDVELYVIGGSVAHAGDLLLEPARRAVPKYAFKSVSSRVTIVATKLHERAPILGCAWQARQSTKEHEGARRTTSK